MPVTDRGQLSTKRTHLWTNTTPYRPLITPNYSVWFHTARHITVSTDEEGDIEILNRSHWNSRSSATINVLSHSFDKEHHTSMPKSGSIFHTWPGPWEKAQPASCHTKHGLACWQAQSNPSPVTWGAGPSSAPALWCSAVGMRWHWC